MNLGVLADRIAAGETVTCRPVGNSKRPVIPSGAEVLVARVIPKRLDVDDIVLVRVAGHVYLHKVEMAGAAAGEGSNDAVVAGAWSPCVLGASSPSKVWCGTRGTGACRFEHEPQILIRSQFPSDPLRRPLNPRR